MTFPTPGDRSESVRPLTEAQHRQVVEALTRAESAAVYSSATLYPSNWRERRGDWVEVHAGRATSANRQLDAAAEQLRAALAILQAAPQAAPVAAVAGWKLVPVEPTEAMFQAWKAIDDGPIFDFCEAYKAMLAATPSLEAPAGVPVERVK